MQIKPILDFKCYCEEFYKEIHFEELYKSTENPQWLNVSEYWTSLGKAHGEEKSGNQEQYSKQYSNNYTCINTKLVKEQKGIRVKV